MKAATLVLLGKQPITEILLGYKKIGFGQGKYAGFGGKVEPGETAGEAAVRELAEETGIAVPVSALELGAILEFRFPHKPENEHRVHTFICRNWVGNAQESTEMIPQMFAVDQIPYEEMWDDAHYWLPKILAGDRFAAKFEFSPDNETVAKVKYSPLKT